MSHLGRKTPSFPDLLAPGDDEGSSVRAREVASQSRLRQSPEVSSGTTSVTSSNSSPSSVRGSLDDRLEKKLRIAMDLARGLPPGDARVRLVHVAVMRRDETLLDGVLAELNKPGPRG